MSTQPEALRIANECEQSAKEWLQEVETRKQAAAHIRRLVAENEAAKELVQQMSKFFDLKWDAVPMCLDWCDDAEKILAAAREWLGQKGETG